MGSIHFQVNDGCDPALFVSGFNSEDPGVLSIAQRFLGLPPDILSATLGDLGVEEVVGLEAQIPDNVAIGTGCQPIVSGNAAPSGISSWTANTATAAPSVPTSSSGQPVNHLIKVGADGLNYTPSNITAAPGDTVTFEFHPKNHTVTQSALNLDLFLSLLMRLSFPTFTITINDTTPIWGYCGQQGPPVHCTSGMVFSINAVESGPNNFAAFKHLAMDSGSCSIRFSLSGRCFWCSPPATSSHRRSSHSWPINGVLFIGLIVIGVMYIRKHRAAARVARHRQLYTSIGATGEPIFVANEKMERHPPTTTGRAVRAAPTESEDDEASQGLTHGPYYDPHEQKGFYDGPEPRPTR
ncbi:hypothetical protein C8F01DRAFT_1261672 [Mycena amicta]|nr:hypothetical protein C8F01DRAFT_1261672 [Mycena amicta]